MSYCATGDGWLTLRFDEKTQEGVKAKLQARWYKLYQAALKSPGAFQESIIREYQEKKRKIEERCLSDSLESEFYGIGFSEVSATEDPAQQTLYIEMSFDKKYYEEHIMGLLEPLAPYTVEGEFSFHGEDGALWRLFFTGAEWEEHHGEVVYTDLDASGGAVPCPPLVEDVGTFEALLSEVAARLKSDARPAPQRGRQLMMAFQNQDPDGVLVALTGWSLRSLGALAGIWQGGERS